MSKYVISVAINVEVDSDVEAYQLEKLLIDRLMEIESVDDVVSIDVEELGE